MAIIVTMDRTGTVVIPPAVREWYGLTGDANQLEVVERSGEIVLRPVRPPQQTTRDDSGWVVFRSDPTDAPLDPVDIVNRERDRRIRELSLPRPDPFSE
jgi:bifunctional DNA-binding transcriptional regulator/antitoxin component of YhaV-PrlF toxin-antitoxin module